MKISIIIPNYNGINLLKKNLPYVFEAAKYYQEKNKGEVEVIIIDDASSDNSLKEIQSSKFKVQSYNLKFKIIKNEKNLGFSPSVNKGVKEAKGEVVVLLNSDVVPQKDFLIPLIEHFKEEKIFAVGCMDKSIESDGKIALRGRGIGKWQRGFLVHSRGEVDKTDTLWVNGGSGAFRKLIWEKLGGFNELYKPFYWEDIDLSYRALKSGYKVVFESKSIVIHEHEKGAIKQKYSPFQIKTIAYKNQFIFVWKNATDSSLKFLHLFWLPYHCLKALLRRDLPFFLGFLKASIFLPQIIQSRFKSKNIYINSDAKTIQKT